MKNSLLTISHPKHFHWLRVALRSLARNASGWDSIILGLPGPITPEGQWVIDDYNARSPRVPLVLHTFEEHPKGKLGHMVEILRAPDYAPDVDYFYVWDSDMAMIEPINVQEFYRNGKPMLGWEWFDRTIRALPDVSNWKKAAERALGFPVLKDFMRWFPIIHSRAALLKTREMIPQPWADYILAQQNTFPEGFAEFNTIGPVAERCCASDYTFTRFPAYEIEDGTHCYVRSSQVDPPVLSKLYKGWGWQPFSANERALLKDFLE